MNDTQLTQSQVWQAQRLLPVLTTLFKQVKIQALHKYKVDTNGGVDRQRRKNEALANEIFGRSRTGKDSSRSNDKGSSRSSSLASRVGIVKVPFRYPKVYNQLYFLLHQLRPVCADRP